MIELAKKVEVILSDEGRSGHVYVNVSDVPPTGVVILKAKVSSGEPYFLYDDKARVVGKTFHDMTSSAWVEIRAMCARVTSQKYKLRKSLVYLAVSRKASPSGDSLLQVNAVAHIQKVSSKHTKLVYAWSEDEISS